MASVTVRVDADTKQKAANIAEDLGLDLSSVTRAFYKQIVRERRIPLNLSYTTVPPETMEALDEAMNRLADGQPRFNSADEMLDSLGICTMLKPDYTAAFQRDIKKLKRKHTDLRPLKEVIRLVLEDTADSKEALRRRHRAHTLTGDLNGVLECHIGNAGDWLLLWIRDDGTAMFMRTGSHDELLGK